jgi:hypothetical protein
MRVFSTGLRSSFHPWAEAGPLKGPRSRWIGIPRYLEYRQLRGTSRDFATTTAAMFEQGLWRSAIWCSEGYSLARACTSCL